MERDFSLLQSVQAGFGAISASYSMDTGMKAAGAWCSTSVKNEWIYISTPHMPLWLVQEQHILLILDGALYGNEECSVTFNEENWRRMFENRVFGGNIWTSQAGS